MIQLYHRERIEYLGIHFRSVVLVLTRGMVGVNFNKTFVSRLIRHFGRFGLTVVPTEKAIVQCCLFSLHYISIDASLRNIHYETYAPGIFLSTINLIVHKLFATYDFAALHTLARHTAG